MKIMTAKDLIAYESYKFVRVDGEYRFSVVSMWTSHRDLVKPGEVATSAGMIAIGEDYWQMLDRLSTTLNVGTDEKTDDELTALLGKRRQKDRWE